MSTCCFILCYLWFSLPIRSMTVPGRRVGSRSLSSLSSLWRSMWVFQCSKLLTRLPSVYWTTFIPLPETRWLGGGGSISVHCIILNEFLVSFSENGIWVANLGSALGPLTVLWEGNRHAGSFLLCFLSLAPESTLYLSPQARCDQDCLSQRHTPLSEWQTSV